MRLRTRIPPQLAFIFFPYPHIEMSAASKAVKYATHGAVSAGMFKFASSGLGNTISLGGVDVPTWVVGGAVGAGASMLSDMAHAWILPHISANKRFENLESAALAPAVSAGATVALYKALGAAGDGGIDLKQAALIGAAGEIISVYAYGNVVLPQLDTNVKPVSYL